MAHTRNMLIIFPADQINKRLVDSAFGEEYGLAVHYGMEVALLETSHEGYKLIKENRDTKPDKFGQIAIYRGWMMTSKEYASFYAAVEEQTGYRLINNPEEYRYCHELPQWYCDLEPHTPKSIVIPGPFKDPVGVHKWGEIYSAVKNELGHGPYLVKDYVKSQKHYWKEACFIENSESIIKIATRLLELQGEDLNGGLVFRKFEDFEMIGTHVKSDMPICFEKRCVFLGGNLLKMLDYWAPDEINRAKQDKSFNTGFTWMAMQEIAAKVKSNFFTADFARLASPNYKPDEGWRLVELGDAQVAGLPSHADKKAFYEKLMYRFTFNDKDS